MNETPTFDGCSDPEFEIRLNGQNLSIASKVSLRLSAEESEAMKAEFSEFILKALTKGAK